MANKTTEYMDRHLKGVHVTKRMEMAVKAVLDGKMNQSESARHHGVSRPKLNQKIRAITTRIEEQQARSAAAAAERRQATEAPAEGPQVPSLRVEGEVRRVPPFEEFARKYFGNLECPDCGRHHDLPGFHSEMMGALSGPARRLLINMPPYHAKSTVATVQHSVYELCKDPNIRILIVSKSQRLAERFLYQISKYLSDPSIYPDGANLIQDWGPFTTGSEQWNKQQIYVAGRQSAEKDPSLSALGVGGHIYGIRADIIKFDDIADLENQKNLDRVQEMLTWCTQEAASRVGRNGKLQFIGTRISAGDVYSHLQGLPAYDVLRYPCIIDEESKLTLWPDHFAYHNAVEMRDSMSAEQWQLVYQNVDTPGFGASFPPEVIEACYDSEFQLGRFDTRWHLIAGLDPAGAGEQSGFTAMVLLGLDKETGKRHLVDLVNVKQMKAPQLRDQIFDWADRYPLRELRVESNGLQSQLVQYNDEINARLSNRGVRVVGHITTKHNKWDPQFGVEAMSALFHNRRVVLPTGTPADRNRIRPLTEQLQAFPMGMVTDLVMAFWFAELGCKEAFQRAQIPMFDQRMKLPPRLASRRRVVDFSDRTVSAPPDPDIHDAFQAQGRPLTEKRFVNVPGSIWVP